MADKKKTEDIVLNGINVNHATIHIVGKSDLVLNKMNASNARALLCDDRKAQAVWEREHKNPWEDIITSVHWKKGIPITGDNSDGLATNRECSKEMMMQMLDPENNAPCITAFGLKKSWGQAVVRQKIDAYSTRFDAAVNIVSDGGLIPVKFAEWKIDERLMSPKRGAPVCVKLNHFIGWSADVDIEYTTNCFSLKEILTIIRYAGFSIGIGSGRSSDYGRYDVADVK